MTGRVLGPLPVIHWLYNCPPVRFATLPLPHSSPCARPAHPSHHFLYPPIPFRLHGSLSIPKVLPERCTILPVSPRTKNPHPQRKHRKMLKDGTSEVWPESVEKIFVDGLRQYWESPWATYSRGRSRWRNQFLVDYLKDAGIERSKKQVASHIQVLRNMWKGEKEYQLVAGGEELFQENGLLAPKSSALRATPADVRVKEESKEAHAPFGPNTPSDCSDFPSENEGTLPSLTCPASARPARTSPHSPSRTRRTGPPPPSRTKGSTCTSRSRRRACPRSPPPWAPASPPARGTEWHHRPLAWRCRHADPARRGRSVRTALVRLAAEFPPMCLRPHQTLPSSLHDVSSPPALHGFSGTVTFAAPWGSVAQCVTRVFAGGVCESVEHAYFEPTTPLSPISMTPVTLPLPESELSRCRWGNIGVETRIVQVVTVDHEELAWITYDLTWTASGPPTAEILHVQRDTREQQHPVAPTPLPEPASFLSLNSWNSAASYAPYASYIPRSQEPPIAYSPYSSLGGSSSGDQQYTHYSSSVLFS
ncbi:hypothetical protein BC826DRAFT_507356 [Russula brevipes]|nr:hypothetical protein BC826DRAFT_507356 [Russula brevipes]